jgi:hypothetical protein
MKKNDNSIEVSQHIEKCIEFNEIQFNNNLRIYNRVIDQSNEIIKLYLELPMKDKLVNKELLNDIEETGISSIENSLTAFVESEINRIGITIKSLVSSYQAEAIKDMQPLKTAIEKLKKIQQENSSSFSGHQYDLSLKNLDIQNEKAVLSDSGKEELKKLFSIYIDDLPQAEVWQGFLNLQKAFNEQADHLKSIGYNMNNLNPLCGPRGIVHEDQNNHLVIRTDFFPHVKKLIAKKEYLQKVVPAEA